MRLIDVDNLKRRIVAFCTGCSTTYLTIDNMMMLINQEGIVDAVPVVHGCWIVYETMSWRHESPKRRKYYRCSNCRTASAVRHKACPNCFARMDADTQEREETK